MEREKIIFFRNFFFAAFIIGLIFALFYFGATVLFWNTGTSWATHFFKIDEKEFGENDSDVELHHALTRAREIARSKGLHYVYTGNVHDREGGSTWCPGCRELLVERDWYELGKWNLEDGRCRSCGYEIAGVFEEQCGDWGARRVPVRMGTAGLTC